MCVCAGVFCMCFSLLSGMCLERGSYSWLAFEGLIVLQAALFIAVGACGVPRAPPPAALVTG